MIIKTFADLPSDQILVLFGPTNVEICKFLRMSSGKQRVYDVISFNHLSKWWSTFWLNMVLVEPIEVDSSIKHLSKNPREIAVKESLRNVYERIIRKYLWKTLEKTISNETNCKPNFTFLKYTIKTWFQSPKKRAHKNKTAKP